MNSKIYKVRVSFETIIRAQNEEEAAAYAKSGTLDEEEERDVEEIKEIHTLEELPPPWDADCLPWGDEKYDEQELGELLAKTNHE